MLHVTTFLPESPHPVIHPLFDSEAAIRTHELNWNVINPATAGGRAYTFKTPQV